MDMQYRRVGPSGLKVSAISLGAWLTYGGSVGEDMAVKTIASAIDQGVNFIDGADAYSGGRAEEVVGKAIKAFRRSDVVISTKRFGRRATVSMIAACRASTCLNQLKTRSNAWILITSISSSATDMTRIPLPRKQCVPWKT